MIRDDLGEGLEVLISDSALKLLVIHGVAWKKV
jgi:hypothetical protein